MHMPSQSTCLQETGLGAGTEKSQLLRLSEQPNQPWGSVGDSSPWPVRLYLPLYLHPTPFSSLLTTLGSYWTIFGCSNRLILFPSQAPSFCCCLCPEFFSQLAPSNTLDLISNVLASLRAPYLKKLSSISVISPCFISFLRSTEH